MNMILDRANTITGWMSGPELLYLAETAHKSKVIVEAGSFQGRSTRAMADNTNGIVHAVDPWLPVQLLNGVGVDTMTFTRFCLNLEKHLDSGRVIAHPMKFTDFQIYDPDFIFIDAMHTYEAVKKDIFHALTLMKKGIIAGHDYTPVHLDVMQAVDEIFGNQITVIDTIWSVNL
jgi:hypothetical protein